MNKLDPTSTALVLIDLQQGILGYAKAPYSGAQVLSAGAELAQRFRALGATVVLVRVGWSDDLRDALQQPVDRPSQTPPGGYPASWLEFPDALAVASSDIVITKRQWGAFYGTELDLQLRRRGIQTIVLGGISTNIGVESTARAAWEHGYALVFAEDATSAPCAEHHQSSFEHIFPRLGRIRTTQEILTALSEG